MPTHGWNALVAGVDERGLADHAVHAAARMARALEAELELAHAVVVPPPAWGADPQEVAGMQAVLLARAREHLHQHLAKQERELELEPKELTARLKVHPGPPGNVLPERVRALGAAALFLGPHLKRNLLDFGSTVRAVMHHVQCGLWVQPEPYTPIRRILVPLDLSEPSLAALGAARSLAACLEAEIDVLYCFVPPELVYGERIAASVGWPPYAVDAMRERSRLELASAMAAIDWEVPHREHFVEGHAADEILKLSADHDLVVMGTHGRSGLASLVLGSVAYSVLRHARRPVLAWREPQSEGRR
jgi:nucleotide-binding universal stress UspA family protein